jgi:hypothetical protein
LEKIGESLREKIEEEKKKRGWRERRRRESRVLASVKTVNVHSNLIIIAMALCSPWLLSSFLLVLYVIILSLKCNLGLSKNLLNQLSLSNLFFHEH